VLEQAPTGDSYLSLFREITQRKVPAILWFGYNSNRERSDFLAAIESTLPSGHSAIAEVSTHVSKIDFVPDDANPGVLGSGMLFSGFSDNLNAAIRDLATVLCEAYHGAPMRFPELGSLVAVHSLL
jgi:hypothetical protein